MTVAAAFAVMPLQYTKTYFCMLHVCADMRFMQKEVIPS